MVDPTERTIKRLFALSGNICAYPGCGLPIIERAGTVTGEVCHIRARHVGGTRFDARQTEEERNGFENLILLCRRHHKVIDSEPDLYTADALTEMKAVHERACGRADRDEDRFFAKILVNDLRRVSVTNNSGNVAINSPGAIQAGSLSVRTSSKKVSVNPPVGTIGADQTASRYVQYLIKRYNEFAADEPSRRTRFSYGAIARNIESNFGSKWQLLPLEKASSVYEYLQTRISKTRRAKINTGRGHSSFSSYEEYTTKHGL